MPVFNIFTIVVLFIPSNGNLLYFQNLIFRRLRHLYKLIWNFLFWMAVSDRATTNSNAYK